MTALEAKAGDLDAVDPSPVKTQPERFEQPYHISLSCGGANVLALFRRLRVDWDGQATYVKPSEAQNEDCFGQTIVSFNAAQKTWDISIASNPAKALIVSIATRQSKTLLSSRKVSVGTGPDNADWTPTNAPNSSVRFTVEGIQAESLWRPLLLTITSALPAFPTGEYALRRNGMDSVYDYAAVQDDVDLDATDVRSVSLRIFDLAGKSICFGRNDKDEAPAHMIVSLGDGTREDGRWWPLQAPVAEHETVLRAGPCVRIRALAELPVILHLIAHSPLTSPFRGTYILLDRLFNFRPIYMQIDPEVQAQGSEGLLAAPISTEVLSDMHRKQKNPNPVLFIYFSSTTDTWRIGTTVGSGYAALESRPTSRAHHPAAVVSRRQGHSNRKTEDSELLTSTEDVRFYFCHQGGYAPLTLMTFRGDQTARTSRLHFHDESPLAIFHSLRTAGNDERANVIEEPDDWEPVVPPVTSTQVKLNEDSRAKLLKFKKRRAQSAVWRRMMDQNLFMPRQRRIDRVVRNRVRASYMSRVGIKNPNGLPPVETALINKVLKDISQKTVLWSQPPVTQSVDDIMKAIGETEESESGKAEKAAAARKKGNKKKRQNPSPPTDAPRQLLTIVLKNSGRLSQKRVEGLRNSKVLPAVLQPLFAMQFSKLSALVSTDPFAPWVSLDAEDNCIVPASPNVLLRSFYREATTLLVEKYGTGTTFRVEEFGSYLLGELPYLAYFPQARRLKEKLDTFPDSLKFLLAFLQGQENDEFSSSSIVGLCPKSSQIYIGDNVPEAFVTTVQGYFDATRPPPRKEDNVAQHIVSTESGDEELVTEEEDSEARFDADNKSSQMAETEAGLDDGAQPGLDDGAEVGLDERAEVEVDDERDAFTLVTTTDIEPDELLAPASIKDRLPLCQGPPVEMDLGSRWQIRRVAATLRRRLEAPPGFEAAATTVAQERLLPAVETVSHPALRALLSQQQTRFLL